MFAYAKGRSLGLMDESSKTEEERASQRGPSAYRMPIMGSFVYMRKTPEGPRALGSQGRPIPPESAHSYLKVC